MNQVISFEFGTGPWGMYDKKDDCWIGNESGPLVYDNVEDARMAATILNERFGYFARILPKTYLKPANKLKDRKTPRISSVEALINLESKD